MSHHNFPKYWSKNDSGQIRIPLSVIYSELSNKTDFL